MWSLFEGICATACVDRCVPWTLAFALVQRFSSTDFQAMVPHSVCQWFASSFRPAWFKFKPSWSPDCSPSTSLPILGRASRRRPYQFCIITTSAKRGGLLVYFAKSTQASLHAIRTFTQVLGLYEIDMARACTIGLGHTCNTRCTTHSTPQ